MNETTSTVSLEDLKSDIAKILESFDEYHLRLILSFVKKLAAK